MKIEPRYVTFEQAKWLKEKGFDLPTLNWYHRGNKKFNTNDLLFSINKLTDNYSAPEQWQVCEWLLINHGIWIDVTLSSDFKFLNLIRDIKNPNTHLGIARVNDSSFFNSPQEATSAAFDYILTKDLI